MAWLAIYGQPDLLVEGGGSLCANHAFKWMYYRRASHVYEGMNNMFCEAAERRGRQVAG